jgi:hypothetical protein
MPEHAHDGQAGAGAGFLTEPVYSRAMPGGGYVRAELIVSQPADLAAERLRGRVVMERRSFVPPSPEDEELIVEEVEGSDQNAVVAELVRIALDNAAIARSVLRRTASSRAD